MNLSNVKLNEIGAIHTKITTLIKYCLVGISQKMVTKRLLKMFRR
jgi:hypothetical protein